LNVSENIAKAKEIGLLLNFQASPAYEKYKRKIRLYVNDELVDDFYPDNGNNIRTVKASSLQGHEKLTIRFDYGVVKPLSEETSSADNRRLSIRMNYLKLVESSKCRSGPQSYSGI
jgi:hypothetical protein